MIILCSLIIKTSRPFASIYIQGANLSDTCLANIPFTQEKFGFKVILLPFGYAIRQLSLLS